MYTLFLILKSSSMALYLMTIFILQVVANKIIRIGIIIVLLRDVVHIGLVIGPRNAVLA